MKGRVLIGRRALNQGGGGVVYQESVAIGQKLKEQMSHKETVQAHGNRNN